MELIDSIHGKFIEDFSQGGYGALRYQGRLCILDVGDLRRQILKETYDLRDSIHLGFTKMYHELREIYWLNALKSYIVGFVDKCPNSQQIKAKHQRLGGLSQDIGIHTWKW